MCSGTCRPIRELRGTRGSFGQRWQDVFAFRDPGGRQVNWGLVALDQGINDPTTIDMVALSPDVRLGQLLAHLGFLGEDQTGRTLWDIDDEQLLAVLDHHRGELAGRTPGAPSPTGAALQTSGSA